MTNQTDRRNYNQSINQIKRGEIWFVNLNYMNTRETSLQQQNRPCIVISNNICNTHSPVITAIPVTSNITKMKLKTQVLIPSSSGLKSDSVALCEQSQSIDKSRLIYKIGECDYDTITKIERAIKIQIGIESSNIDYNYVYDLVIGLNELKLIMDKTGKELKAHKMLFVELVKYCKSYNKDCKEVIEEIKVKYKSNYYSNKIQRESVYA